MNALWYLRKRTFINRVKRAMKRPVTYIYLAGAIAYMVMIFWALNIFVRQVDFASVIGLTAVLTIWNFYCIPANFVSYANRKGIMFRPHQAHFVFTAPISPKVILLDSAVLNMLTSFVFGIVFLVAGVLLFHVSVWKMSLFFVVCFLLEIVIEFSMILILYGSDRFADGKFKFWGKVIKALLLGSALLLVLYFKKNGLSLESARTLVDAPVLRMLPVVGWNISAFRLILLGPDLYNVIGAVLYLLTGAVLVFLAVKMKNTGDYYEEAAKFADDYQEYRKRNKQGEASFSIGGKKKFKQASVRFQSGSRAIFARQLLEYKKERFFIFNYMTLISIGLALVLGFSWSNKGESTPGLYLLGMLAYIMLLTNGYKGKWDKELQNPYLYLIPDTPLKKMWYATKMEHIKAMIDGTLISVIIGILWKIPLWQIVMCILIYTVLQANKLYMKVFAVMLLGNTMGQVGKDILRVLIQSSALGVGLLLAVAAGMIWGENTVYFVVLLFSLAATAGVALLASMKFNVLEQVE